MGIEGRLGLLDSVSGGVELLVYLLVLLVLHVLLVLLGNVPVRPSCGSSLDQWGLWRGYVGPCGH